MDKDSTYAPKQRVEYISKCKYYRGEQKVNFLIYGDRFRIAEGEHRWVDAHYSEEGLQEIKYCLNEYKSRGLGHFCNNDDVPITLKAFLYHFVEKEGMWLPEAYKKWYKEIYLNTGFYTKDTLNYCLSKCRYFKGEIECPSEMSRKQNGSYLWEIERSWIMEGRSYDGEPFHDYLNYVAGKVPNDVDVPVTLQAYLFYRLSKWEYTLESWSNHFYDFLKKYYLDQTNG